MNIYLMCTFIFAHLQPLRWCPKWLVFARQNQKAAKYLIFGSVVGSYHTCLTYRRSWFFPQWNHIIKGSCGSLCGLQILTIHFPIVSPSECHCDDFSVCVYEHVCVSKITKVGQMLSAVCMSTLCKYVNHVCVLALMCKCMWTVWGKGGFDTSVLSFLYSSLNVRLPSQSWKGIWHLTGILERGPQRLQRGFS